MTQTESFDPAAVAAYQFGGQDIPWMIDHWGENRADHPFLIWEPKDGTDRTWTYAEFAEATKKEIDDAKWRRGIATKFNIRRLSRS